MLLASLALTLSATVAGPITVVGPNQIAGAKEPQAAVEGNYVYVVYGSGSDIYCSTSDDRGKSFDPPVRVANAAKLGLGMRRGPRIAIANSALVVTAVSEGNLMAWTSQDNGKGFKTPAQINDMPGSAIEGLHAETAKGTQVVCAWLDNRDGGQNIYASVSQDSGDSWGPNVLVYKSPSGSVCECCHPSVVVGIDGSLNVMFRNLIDGNRDMYVATSTDEGETWSEAKMLGEGHWKIAKCPMDGGAMTGDDQGQMLTIWRRNDTIYRSRAGGKETKIAVGQQPWIYAGQGGVYCVYLKARPGPLMFFKGTAQARAISHDADDPMVAGPDGGDGAVVAVWTTSKGQIMCEVLND